MAHRSKKKHLKHLHQQEPVSAAPAAKKHAGAKADIEADRVARPRSAKTGARVAAPKKPAPKKRGIVRSIARAATKKIVARPKKMIERATSRVKSMLGRE